MKKILILTGLILSFWSLSAQRENNFDRIKALKAAYLTDKVNLSSKEAEMFWPIYNKYEKALYQLKIVTIRDLMQQIRQKGGVDQLSEGEATDFLGRYKKLNQDIFQKEQEKIKELEKVLSARQLIKLYRAEESFKKELIKKLRQERMKRRN